MSKLLTGNVQRAVARVYDIKNCGVRNRFVANGLLVHNSGGGSINPQNLPRGGVLRQSMRAPDGYAIVACDSSNIEVRVEASLAGEEKLLKVFREHGDVYCSFGEQIYGHPINKHDNPEERRIAKTCLAGDTEVLTQRGWVRIDSLLDNDLLWDGEEWVTFLKIIDHGKKDTLTMYGVTATPDHRFWTGEKFVPWETLLKRSSLLQQALDSVHLPFSDMRSTFPSTGDPTDGLPTVGATAGKNSA